MISPTNPFPGMNPYLERRWPDVHTSLISYIKDSIATQLPSGLAAHAEEAIEVDVWEETEPRFYRTDVAVSESWKQGIAPAWTPDTPAAEGELAIKPEIIRVVPITRRWLEIQNRDGKIITLIEILSPVNKRSDGRGRYLRKQEDYLEAGINLVVIDLLRSGQNVLPVPERAFQGRRPVPYHVCVVRQSEPDQRELYRIGLRQRLPVIQIPLRPTDADVSVDLQPLIDRCYEMGRYWQADHTADPEPPLDAEDAGWVAERLRAAGLR
ncbi:MAG: DUF4058 family protein [Prosthecobacter sp.]|uniref:DUF4058 family protein n=1 Tax=Prosthecobacter sp. TaxID=1965333 RepID=UPI003902FB08